MKDYSYLEGKILTVKNHFDTKVKRALVVGVDYDIGITICDADDHDHYMTCLLGDSGFRARYGEPASADEKHGYRERFDFMVSVIESGIYDLSKVIPGLSISLEQRIIGRVPTAADCPFAQ